MTREKSRQPCAARSRRELRERDDAPPSRRAASDVAEVEERVVLLRVSARRRRRVKPGCGSSSAYVFHVLRAAASVSARLRAVTMQSVQSLVIPCVEPETSAR